MDPVGGAASIITLIDVAVKSFKLVNNLIQRYHNASAELIDLKHQLDGLHSQILLLQHVHRSVEHDDLFFTEVEVQRLKHFLQDTIIMFSAIRDLFEQQRIRPGNGSRLKWALHDASKVKQWDAVLRRQSSAVANILLVLNVRYSSLLQTEFRDLKKHLALTIEMTRREQVFDRLRFSWAKNTFGADWVMPYVAKFDGSVLLSKKGEQRIFGISLRFHALFCLRAFCVDLSLCRPSLFSAQMVAVGTGISIKNVIPHDSTIITACMRGETSTVWELLQARRASVNDITPDNFPPLRYAIESGSIELVSFLLNNGADAKGCFGQFQTSPLECAIAFRQLGIARILLNKGADVHHVSAKGWTPAFGLFGALSIHMNPCDEYLQMLSAGSFIDFNAQDGEGWSIMHRAAAYGNAKHVEAIINRHGSSIVQTTKLSWTPIFCAVQFGNISTFKELRKHHLNFLALKDIRNWTLLHIAVNAKRLEMMHLLISLGADPHARSIASDFLVPAELKGNSVTPGDIARFRGPFVLCTYVHSLKTSGHDVEVIRDKEDNSVELFWSASEPMAESEI